MRESSAANEETATEATRPDEAVEEEQSGVSESDECRICRSSATELLDAETSARSSSCPSYCCQRRPRLPPLRRLRCACAGSVRHVCDRCYRRYYVARGLTACEICRQPTGLEGGVQGDMGACRRRRLASFACSNECRLLAYILFIIAAFVSIFSLFFIASAADAANHAAAAAAAVSSETTGTPQPDAQRGLERAIFVGIALVNMGIALVYTGYSYWHYCRQSSRGSGHHQGRRFGGVDPTGSHPSLSELTAAAVTVTIRQQPPPSGSTGVEV